jgi:hypothetical protein
MIIREGLRPLLFSKQEDAMTLVIFKGILLGICVSLVSIALYFVRIRSMFSGPTVIDLQWLVRRPAMFSYGVAIGIGIISTAILLGGRALQIVGEHGARISRQ